MKSFFSRLGQIAVYGASLSLLLFILKWSQWKFFIASNSTEIYIGIIAVLFTCLGIWVAAQFAKARTVIVEKEVAKDFAINETELKKLNLTSREYEVLQLIAEGKSNAEIAQALYLSVSTVKTHLSNLFSKMDVKSRTQAIEKARRLRIIA